ncbi:hypothetical protein GTO89_05175 [Heliobacterium gestii]|uniref:Tetratricopeptide repeat protein n=1 Tax=Heliomicrobium gestii TaxID=2699 RepID=A0A845L737_HELGE|nr:FG-GAP-like repeat-containing protein [Heliomicrobium gestii]MBM7868360.1 tetratricopeptide (TPR) repeat protein [Heliomicrobium gestii]MZP42432.1 hypothetical protein [Heliomicrobium gestii]
MKGKALAVGALLVGSFLSGCGVLTPPSLMIMPPQLPLSDSQVDESLQATVQKFLPPGASLEEPKNPPGAKAIQQVDIDGDGNAEVLATYRAGQKGELGALLLKNNQNHWEKLWQTEGASGLAIDMATVADIDGDGRGELLLGWLIGASAGNGLDIFTWRDHHVEPLATLGYHKLDILPAAHPEVDGKAVALALWRKDTGKAYKIDLVRWTATGKTAGWVHAEEQYPDYYKKVVDYYQERVKEMPGAAFYKYYLADGQVKSKAGEETLATIAAGEELKLGYPEAYAWQLLKGEALNQLGRYAEAQSLLQKTIEQLELSSAQVQADLHEAYYELGKSYEGLRQAAQAKGAYEKSLAATKGLDTETQERFISYPVQQALETLKKTAEQ